MKSISYSNKHWRSKFSKIILFPWSISFIKISIKKFKSRNKSISKIKWLTNQVNMFFKLNFKKRTKTIKKMSLMKIFNFLVINKKCIKNLLRAWKISIITWTLSKINLFSKYKKMKISFNKIRVKSLLPLRVKRIKSILHILICLKDMPPQLNNFYSNIIPFKQLYRIHVKVWHYWNIMTCKANKITIYPIVYQRYLNQTWMKRKNADLKSLYKRNVESSNIYLIFEKMINVIFCVIYWNNWAILN